jgi:hypothetical protein
MTPEKLKWILADHGHGREWARVFRIGDEDAERLWNAIARAALDAPVFRVIDRGKYGTVCSVAFPLTLNTRTAKVTTSWHYQPQVTRHACHRLPDPLAWNRCQPYETSPLLIWSS